MDTDLSTLVNFGVLGVMLLWFIRDNLALRTDLQEATRRHREDLRKIAGLPPPTERDDD
jgi:hypothetical protein